MPRASLTGRRRVSGEVVISKVSGEVVKVSGETIELASGTGPVSVSGQPIKISGETVELASGTGPVSVSGQPIKISGETVIAEVSGETVVAEVSGEPVKISGETVIAKVSGETVVTKISGETVVAEVSGEPVKVSGETVIAKVSGEVVDLKVPTTVKTAAIKTVIEAASSASAGEVLHSGAVVSVTVKALAGNSGDIYVGGATDKPYSGFGFCLEAGEAINLDVSDFDDVYVGATISGDKVTFLGIN